MSEPGWEQTLAEAKRRGGAPEDEDRPALLDLLAKIHITIGELSGEMASERKRRQRLYQGIHPLNVGQLSVLSSGSSGGLDAADLLGPHQGYAWDVHAVICSGFTAGSVAMYTGGTPLSVASAGQGNIEFNFSSAGQLTYGKGQLVLMPGDRLTFWASGITGVVNVKVRGIEMEQAVWPDYII